MFFIYLICFLFNECVNVVSAFVKNFHFGEKGFKFKTFYVISSHDQSLILITQTPRIKIYCLFAQTFSVQGK